MLSQAQLSQVLRSNSAPIATISGPVLVSRTDYVPPAFDGQSLGGVVYIAENPALAATRADVMTNEGNIAANAGNIATNATGIASNAGRIIVNSNRIGTNATNIASNLTLLNANTASIGENTTLILQNTAGLEKATKGIAGVASMPDMFLNSDETLAVSGGVGFFGSEIGLGATVAQRLDKNWSFGASIAVSGDTAAGKLQARWSH